MRLSDGDMMDVCSDPLAFLRGYDIMLASGSPRRRELLAMLGLDFSVSPVEGIDESYPADLPVEEVPHFLALKKCDACRKSLMAGQLVITADTVVVSGDRVLGKPQSISEAVDMLHELSGCSHRVITGVAVATMSRIISDSSVTTVDFAPLSDAEIRYYVERFRPLDKAGAYGIQEWIGAVGVRRIEGSFYNVMGLPVNMLYGMLRELTEVE